MKNKNLRSYGYIKTAAAAPEVTVADCEENYKQMIKCIDYGDSKNVDLLVFPELCITGCTCSDLFMQRTLLDGALETLYKLRDHSINTQDMIIIAGLPVEYKNALYNAAAVIQNGMILGIVPKTYIPAHSEFYEGRYFSSGRYIKNEYILKEKVPFGTDLIFSSGTMENYKFAVEICEDLWAIEPPSGKLAAEGAVIIANLSAGSETVNKAEHRRNLVKSQSARTLTAYIYADAGEGESTTDAVYAGHNIIAENGKLLNESERFTAGIISAHVDIDMLSSERRCVGTFGKDRDFAPSEKDSQFRYIVFQNDIAENRETLTLERYINPAPFVPSDKTEREERCREILNIQSAGLRKRVKHTNLKNAVIGISGGLDSTLALLVTVKTFDALNISRKNIHAITMPCFGTSDRTYKNSVKLCGELGVSFREINIKDSVIQHFKDIGHDIENKDIIFENSQARERTQILMDISNQVNGLVIGTGDLSELALGWATYNGDHMSMYSVNSSVPKTLVRHLIEYFSKSHGIQGDVLNNTLEDILDTPVSPELLPTQDGKIVQKTEDTVGPYELHDFFLYNAVRFYFKPSKIYMLAQTAFNGKYDDVTIKKWLKVFYKRFFTQQFKRSCLPDGPKVGSVSLSPRGDLRMPSDAAYSMWMRELEDIL